MKSRIERGFALGDYLLMTILVVGGIMIGLALFGVSLDQAWEMSIGQLDRSVSGVTGGSATYNAAHRPDVTTPISPMGGDVSTGIVTLTWQGHDPAQGVDRYRVTLQRYVNLKVISFWVPAGTRQVRCNLGVGCASANAAFPITGKYRWKVQAHNGKGWGSSAGFNYLTAK